MNKKDREMIHLCGRAMNYHPKFDDRFWFNLQDPNSEVFLYDPLTNGSQALDLVKRFKLHIFEPNSWAGDIDPKGWVVLETTGTRLWATDEDLNRAIVKCVAKVQEDREDEDGA
jgi:hypothetical protein